MWRAVKIRVKSTHIVESSGLHGRSIRDLINGVGLVDAQITKDSSHFHPISPPPRQSVPESTIRMFSTRILTAASCMCRISVGADWYLSF